MKAEMGGTSVCQGKLKFGSKTPGPRSEAWNRFFPTALERNQLCQHLDLGLVASRTVRKYISVVEATQPVALCYDNPGR